MRTAAGVRLFANPLDLVHRTRMDEAVPCCRENLHRNAPPDGEALAASARDGAYRLGELNAKGEVVLVDLERIQVREYRDSQGMHRWYGCYKGADILRRRRPIVVAAGSD
jgi:hypothetical protein